MIMYQPVQNNKHTDSLKSGLHLHEASWKTMVLVYLVLYMTVHQLNCSLKFTRNELVFSYESTTCAYCLNCDLTCIVYVLYPWDDTLPDICVHNLEVRHTQAHSPLLELLQNLQPVTHFFSAQGEPIKDIVSWLYYCKIKHKYLS
jgi:hypothetical protein